MPTTKINGAPLHYSSAANRVYQRITDITQAYDAKATNVHDIQDKITIGVAASNDFHRTDIKSFSQSQNNTDNIGILRNGDKIDRVLKQNNNSNITSSKYAIKTQNNATESFKNDSVKSLIQNGLTKSLDKLRFSQKKAFSIVNTNSETNLIEIVDAVNNAEITLQQVVAVRDKFLAAYQKVLDMPL